MLVTVTFFPDCEVRQHHTSWAHAEPMVKRLSLTDFQVTYNPTV